ncbi:uncharacterized protein LOC112153747 isoform X3 [Oryzias melastigma]|uniref:uncharacterized protein LOC112153747 isoform X3 n=1 Tax=Oryzias melastigma TaxID=30732 RepID=UPI000CF7CA74|nr:uncharacterized protein LOC112153747 isoform X3 [Oryzias melastigma]
MCLTGEVSHSFPLTAVTIRAITFWLPWIRLWRFIPAAGEAAATTQTHVSSQADSASRDERYLKANLHMSDPLRQQLHWLSSKNPAGMNCPLQHTHLCRPPPAGGLCLQPGGFVPAALPSHLHQTLYCDPGPAGPHRRPGVAAVGSPGWGDALLCDGEEDEPAGWGFGGREVTVPAAAGEPLPGLSAAAGSAGFGGRLGVPLASADPEV